MISRCSYTLLDKQSIQRVVNEIRRGILQGSTQRKPNTNKETQVLLVFSQVFPVLSYASLWIVTREGFPNIPFKQPYKPPKFFPCRFSLCRPLFGGVFETIQGHTWEVFWRCFRRFQRYTLLLFRPLEILYKAYLLLFDTVKQETIHRVGCIRVLL